MNFFKKIVPVLLVLLTGCQMVQKYNVAGLTPNHTDHCDTYKTPLRNLSHDYEAKAIDSVLNTLLTGAEIAVLFSNNDDFGSTLLKGLAGIDLLRRVSKQLSSAPQNQQLSNRYKIESGFSKLSSNERQMISDVPNSVQKMYECRVKQYKTLSKDYKDGKITKNVALQENSKIDSLVKIDKQLIEYVLSQTDDRYNKISDYRLQIFNKANNTKITYGIDYIVTAQRGLKVRRAPNSTADRITTLAFNSHLIGEEGSNGWVKTLINGEYGYLSRRYLKANSGGEGSQIATSHSNSEIDGLGKDIKNNRDVKRQNEEKLQQEKELAEAIIFG